MPKYKDVPDPDTWLKDTGDPQLAALQPINDMIGEYYALQTRGRRRGAVTNIVTEDDRDRSLAGSDERLLLQFRIERAANWLIRNAKNADKTGAELPGKALEALKTLHKHVRKQAKKALDATDANYEQKAVARFGRSVVDHEKQKDEDELSKGQLEYFTSAQEQKELKLSFRGGLAKKWSFAGKKGSKTKKTELEIYDTREFGDAHFSESGASLYAMNKSAIFVFGKEKEKKLKHSSLLAGADVLCAGTMRIEHGKIIWLTGRSGHYKPSVDQILLLLERLRQYGVDLDGVQVYRENFYPGHEHPNNPSGHPQKNFEGCAALGLLKARAWPDGSPEHAKLMRVDPPKENKASTATTPPANTSMSTVASSKTPISTAISPAVQVQTGSGGAAAKAVRQAEKNEPEGKALRPLPTLPEKTQEKTGEKSVAKPTSGTTAQSGKTKKKTARDVESESSSDDDVTATVIATAASISTRSPLRAVVSVSVPTGSSGTEAKVLHQVEKTEPEKKTLRPLPTPPAKTQEKTLEKSRAKPPMPSSPGSQPSSLQRGQGRFGGQRDSSDTQDD